MPTDAEKLDAAQRAVKHLLERIKEDQATRYQIGFGTQSYELLTRAASVLFDTPVEKVREFYPG